MPWQLQLVLILFCLCGAAFFSGMETGVISINRLRLMHRARNGSRQASLIGDFLRQPDRLLGTTLVGTNLFCVTISTLMANLAEHLWGAWGQGLAGAVAAVLILICAEFLPKAWFSSRPLERCLPFARLLRAAEWLCKPLAALVTVLTNWASPRDRKGGRTPFVTREHLQMLTRDSEAGGQISTFERLMIHRVLDLQLKTAADILTPLDRVARVRADATVSVALQAVRGQGHMKIPVFSADDATCVGVLYMQDVLAKALDWESESVASHLQPPFFLDDDVRADDVLPLLRRHRQHIAMVRDREGRVRGIVTIENVLKILVGNLPATATGDRKADPGAAIVAPPGGGDGLPVG
jgi:CBS domain containing-hemolysin-like protein